MKIILASQSPRRKQILKGLGIEVEIISNNVDEKFIREKDPRALVQKLALLKARDTAKSIDGDALVIGADTIVYLNGRILGKPKNMEEAREMLRTLSGKRHMVCTGICLINTKTGKTISGIQETVIEFQKLTSKDINSYVSSGEVLDWAGSYAIQREPKLVKNINGSYTNVMGLPVEKLIPMLRENGVEA